MLVGRGGGYFLSGEGWVLNRTVRGGSLVEKTRVLPYLPHGECSLGRGVGGGVVHSSRGGGGGGGCSGL